MGLSTSTSAAPLSSDRRSIDQAVGSRGCAESASSSSSGSRMSQCTSRLQERGLRPAALEAASPEPGMIGEKLGDATLADALEDQQRSIGNSGHEHLAVGGLDVDLAKPSTPFVRRAETGGDRMKLADLGDRGQEAALEDLARRACRGGREPAVCETGS